MEWTVPMPPLPPPEEVAHTSGRWLNLYLGTCFDLELLQKIIQAGQATKKPDRMDNAQRE